MFWTVLEDQWTDWSRDLALLFPHLDVPDLAPSKEDQVSLMQKIAALHDLTEAEVREILEDLTLHVSGNQIAAEAVAA